MANNTNKLLEITENLVRDNTALRQQLREAKGSIDAINAGNIDAVVIGDSKHIKVLTEKTANKIYRVIIEKMNDGAVTLNKSGIILYCNSSFAKMVRVPLQKVIGTKFKNFIANPSKKRFETLLRQYGTNPLKEEISMHTYDGTSIPVLISLNTLSLDSHFVLSIILTDLTIHNKYQEELKRRTGQLQEKNKELEIVNNDLVAFTYVSSHDLQEPLRKIQTFVALIAEEELKNLSDTGKDYFLRMQQTANRMQKLIDDLITYSRTKTTDRKFIKTDLSVIAEQVKKDFKEVIREKKATIEYAGLCKTKAIPFQIRQLLRNLVSNSLKFSNPGKRIHITIKSKISPGGALNKENLFDETDYCHIIYTDNGIGFDPKYKDRIFEVFQRLHSKEEYPGTGMGLAICKRIVENHNGIITATGKLTRGARFDIYLPAN